MWTIGIIIFPQVEEMDFVAPFEVLNYINKVQPSSTTVKIIAATLEPVVAFNGLKVIPDYSFANCPPLDIVVVPGGKGRMTSMYDKDLRKFIVAHSHTAKYTTSVCTGAFILAEANLLRGKAATTYHSALDELRKYPEITVVDNKKVVHVDNIITAAGVTSGLELGFYLLQLLFGKDLARKVAAGIEYRIDWENLGGQ